MNHLLEHLQCWVDENAVEMAAKEMYASVTHGHADRDKLSAWIDIDSPTRLVRLIVWDSGEANLSVADMEDDDLVVDEQLEISSRFNRNDGEIGLWSDG